MNQRDGQSAQHKISNGGHRSDEVHWKKILQANRRTSFYSETSKHGRQKDRVRRRSKHRKQHFNTNTQNVGPSIVRRIYNWLNSRFGDESDSIDTSSGVALDTEIRRNMSDSGNERLAYTFENRPRNTINRGSLSDIEDFNYVYIRNTKTQSRESLSNECTRCSPSISVNTLGIPIPFHQNCSNSQTAHKRQKDPDERRILLTSRKSCPPKSVPSTSTFKSDHPCINRSKTWPKSRKQTHGLNENKDEDTNTVYEEPTCLNDCEKRISQFESENPETLGEFSIPHNDLEFGDCVRQGEYCHIYRGKWHGEMDIHYFGNRMDAECDEFWKTVTKLRRIRHENAALFMGACVDPDHLSIVQSVEGGSSLYDQIHIKKLKITPRCRILYLSQIANGMGYLHAKGVVHKHLSTRNVFICPKARISVMDYGFPETHHGRPGYATLPKGKLAYLAPEILSTVTVVPPTLLTPSDLYNTETDVYAFGTIVFELLAYRFPFNDAHPEVCIYVTCKGYGTELDRITGTRSLKFLAESCWSLDKSKRPKFMEISRELSRSGCLHKTHSSSEPEKIHRS